MHSPMHTHDLNLKNSRLFSLLAGVFIFLLLFAGPTLAQFDQPSRVQTELISEVQSVSPGSSFWVAVRMTMDDHWHTYWRNPGDSGLETTIDWDLPEGFSAGLIHWPYPERIEEPPLTVFGYHHTIYLLTEISVDAGVKTGQDVMIKATVHWLECADVCVPGQADPQYRLKVKEGAAEINPDHLQTFSEARSQLPLTQGEWKVHAALNDKHVVFALEPPDWYQDEINTLHFFPYQGEWINNTDEQRLGRRGNLYELKVDLAKLNPQIPDTITGILVNDSGWRGSGSERAMQIEITDFNESPILRGSADALTSVWLAILFSFLGGIILNLMPCVLPVLSIKLMGFINQAHEEHSKSWQHGVFFTLGVLVSFWALAAILLILKAGGAQLGWGFQLQSPAFLIVLSAFMFLFGLSLFGVFEIGTSLTTVAGKTQQSSGFAGSFLTGITATIVATPCTAPFMGSALGFAITQPAWVSMLVFTFIGLGMAAPYMLISSVPALLKFVPKPGRWMESLKQFMGFLLVATVLWLLWVLGLQTGSNVVIMVLAALLVTAIGAWIYGRWGNLAMPQNKRIVAALLAFVFIIAANGYAISKVDDLAINPQGVQRTSGGINWLVYSDEDVETARQSGEPLFIDFTAAWCLSCQVNEQVAFGSREVQEKFKELGIKAFKADWTSRDETITQALARYGRNSVPLYVLYSGRPGEPPRILPEIITPGIVLKALQETE